MSAARSIESIATGFCLHVFVCKTMSCKNKSTNCQSCLIYTKTEHEVLLKEMPQWGRLSFCKINLCDAGILKWFPFLGDWSFVLWFSASLPILSGTNGKEHKGEFPAGLSYILFTQALDCIRTSMDPSNYKTVGSNRNKEVHLCMYVRKFSEKIQSKGIRMILSFIKWNIRV